MMKKLKLTAFIAMVGMAATLTACGSKGGGTVETTKAGETTASEVKETTKSKKTDPGIEFTIGETGSTSYSNKFFDVAFEASGDWYVASKDQLAQLTKVKAEAINDKDIKASLESGKTSTLFFAQESTGNNKVNLVSGKTANGVSGITSEQLINSLVPSLKKTYESQGYSNTTITKEKVKFLGEDVQAIRVKGQYRGRDIYNTQVVIINKNYYGILNATSFEKDENQKILDMIKAANR